MIYDKPPQVAKPIVFLRNKPKKTEKKFKFTASVPTLSGPNKGKMYVHYFQTEEERDAYLLYIEKRKIRETHVKNPVEVVRKHKSNVTRARKDVATIVRRYSERPFKMQQELVSLLERPETANRYRYLESALREHGFLTESIAARTKAESMTLMERKEHNLRELMGFFSQYKLKETG